MRPFLLAALLVACSTDDGGGGGPPPDSALAEPADAMPRADMAEPGADMHPGDDMAAPDGPVGVQPGERAPNFALLDADGERVALADFRGRPVLVAGASAW